MIVVVSPQAEKKLQKLPKRIRDKARKQFKRLSDNYRHSSLQTKKMQNSNIFEARVDLHYRFTFFVERETILVVSVGMHDTGLGKK